MTTLCNAGYQALHKVTAVVQDKETGMATLTFFFEEVLSYSDKVSTLLNEIFYPKKTIVFKKNYHYQIHLPRNFK